MNTEKDMIAGILAALIRKAEATNNPIAVEALKEFAAHYRIGLADNEATTPSLTTDPTEAKDTPQL